MANASFLLTWRVYIKMLFPLLSGCHCPVPSPPQQHLPSFDYSSLNSKSYFRHILEKMSGEPRAKVVIAVSPIYPKSSSSKASASPSSSKASTASASPPPTTTPSPPAPRVFCCQAALEATFRPSTGVLNPNAPEFVSARGMTPYTGPTLMHERVARLRAAAQYKM